MSTNSLFSPDNHLLKLARSGRAIASPIYPIGVTLFGLILPLLGGILAVIPLGIFVMIENGSFDEGQLNQVGFAAQLFASFVPIYFLIWGWLYLFENRHLWTAGFERAGWLVKYGRGLLIGFFMFGAVVGTMALLGMVEPEISASSAATGSLFTTSIILFLAWIVQGGAEELLARGFVMPIIGTRWGTAAGIAGSSLLFMVLHLLNANINPIGLLNLALFGVFTALFALYEGGLWGVCAMHSVWNWAQANFFGLPVSGYELESGLLFNLMEVGPDWATGGAFGPEGGLITTAVLLISTILVFIAQRRTIA